MLRNVRQQARPLVAQDHLVRRREGLAARATRIRGQVLEATPGSRERDQGVVEPKGRIGDSVHARAVAEPVIDAAELSGLDIREVSGLPRARACGTESVPAANPVSREAGKAEKG